MKIKWQLMCGKYSQIPVCNTIKKILIGKLINWYNNNVFVILGVRRNNLHGHLEILVGNIPQSKKYGLGNCINVYSWYCFNRRNIHFIGRDNKEAIRKCLKENPKYIKYHLGKQFDPSKFVFHQEGTMVNYVSGTMIIYDNYNYYAEYLKIDQ